ncbi:MAG: hypothetical protein ACM3Q2_09790, partial [Syntrophothermus sp.]
MKFKLNSLVFPETKLRTAVMGNNTEFQIKYDGELHQIDANVLINSLLAFTTTIQEINRSLEPERKIQIKVNALEKG